MNFTQAARRMVSGTALLAGTLACADHIADSATGPHALRARVANDAGSGRFRFTPLASSAVCTNGGNPEQPFILPAGYTQRVIAREGDGGSIDLWDMNTQNETGAHAGRYLYRTSEVRSNGQVSVTDLETLTTRIVAQRADWERLDGLAWTPWGTILVAEEVTRAAFPDLAVPQAQAGLVYEIDPETGAAVARPAIGSRSHEGLRFDPQGNLYGISETSPGYIYRFVPDRRGDLSSGQLYALKVTTPTGDRTGEAVWVPLDRTTVQVLSDAAATAAGATGYGRPEDVEIFTSTGNSRDGLTLYVAITSEHRVLAVDLREPTGGSDHATAFVYDYVRAGVNAPVDFNAPDNLALDKAGVLYITEDPATAPATQRGDDVWAANPAPGGQHQPASSTVRFASLTDCIAEPSGIYFDKRDWTLYANVMHRGGDGRDLLVEIRRVD